MKSKKYLNNFSELGKRVRELREGHCLQQKDLASILGYQNNTSVSKIELGIKPPSADDFIKIAQAFNVDLHQLIVGKPFPRPNPWMTLTAELSKIIEESIDFLHDRIASLIKEKRNANRQLKTLEAAPDKEDSEIESLRKTISELREKEYEFQDTINRYHKFHKSLMDALKIKHVNDLQHPQK